MDGGWTQAIIDWINAHPNWAVGLVFALAFVESLVLVGILVPGIVILFAVGALIGLDALDLLPIWLAGSLGAFLGDALSYEIGHRYRSQLKELWPFSRYPGLLQRGQVFFEHHGTKSVLAGRFIGPLRPIIPAVAGMLGMLRTRFLAVAIPAAILWTPAYLLPGMLFGASLELAAEYAGRLALVAFILVLLIALVIWAVKTLYLVFSARSARWLNGALAWTRRHPLLGRWTRPLFDAEQPEAMSIAVMGLVLVVLFWSILGLLFLGPFATQPQVLDQQVSQIALSLRNPVADQAMFSLTRLGRWAVLLPAAVVIFLWLAMTGHQRALLHWVIAIVGAVGLQLLLNGFLRGTPLLSQAQVGAAPTLSGDMVLATVSFGFLALLVARSLRGSWRRMPYAIAAGLLTLLLLARLYLGLDWFSGALISLAFGLVWTLIVGIAYRQRAQGVFNPLATAMVFVVALAVGLGWQVARFAPEDRAALVLPLAEQHIPAQEWRNQAWQQLPRYRSSLRWVPAREFNLQLALPKARLLAELIAHGWTAGKPADWRWPLQALNPKPTVESLPLLGKNFAGRGEVLKLYYYQSGQPGLLSLRLWDSGTRLLPGQQPVYLGQLARESIASRLLWFRYWLPQPPSQQDIEQFVGHLGELKVNQYSDLLLIAD